MSHNRMENKAEYVTASRRKTHWRRLMKSLLIKKIQYSDMVLDTRLTANTYSQPAQTKNSIKIVLQFTIMHQMKK
jgi:hypothetical protein